MDLKLYDIFFHTEQGSAQTYHIYLMTIADFSFLLSATSTLFQQFDVPQYHVYVIHSLIHYPIYFNSAKAYKK